MSKLFVPETNQDILSQIKQGIWKAVTGDMADRINVMRDGIYPVHCSSFTNPMTEKVTMLYAVHKNSLLDYEKLLVSEAELKQHQLEMEANDKVCELETINELITEDDVHRVFENLFKNQSTVVKGGAEVKWMDITEDELSDMQVYDNVHYVCPKCLHCLTKSEVEGMMKG